MELGPNELQYSKWKSQFFHSHANNNNIVVFKIDRNKNHLPERHYVAEACSKKKEARSTGSSLDNVPIIEELRFHSHEPRRKNWSRLGRPAFTAAFRKRTFECFHLPFLRVWIIFFFSTRRLRGCEHVTGGLWFMDGKNFFPGVRNYRVKKAPCKSCRLVPSVSLFLCDTDRGDVNRARKLYCVRVPECQP